MSQPGHAPGLRVAQVVCTDGFAGIERYVSTLANGLAEHGCHVTVLGGNPARMRAELSRAVECQPARSTAEAALRLARLGRTDIVHAHMSEAELAGALTKPRTRAKLVASRHFAAPRGTRPVGRLAARLVPQAIDLQLAVSDYVAERIDGRSVVVSPGTATIDGASPVDDSHVVLVLQRLEPQKDTATALRAWAQSGLGEHGWTLHVVGGGSSRGALERLATELRIERSCRFLGPVPDVEAQLRRAAILLATQPNEGFGLSVVEAMARGIPVVASAAGGHLETVGAHPHAALFPAGDAGAAAQQLRRLAQDGDARLRYGRELAALQRSRFTAERQTRDTLAQYVALGPRMKPGGPG